MLHLFFWELEGIHHMLRLSSKNHIYKCSADLNWISQTSMHKNHVKEVHLSHSMIFLKFILFFNLSATHVNYFSVNSESTLEHRV